MLPYTSDWRFRAYCSRVLEGYGFLAGSGDVGIAAIWGRRGFARGFGVSGLGSRV